MNGLGLDQVFTRTVGSTTRSVLADALGSTIALADDRGAITGQFAYGPFGESDTTTDHPFQYTGRENDGTGLYQYRNRYYSPAMKRFISEDPTGMAGSGINLYAYVNDDPLDFNDPLGTTPWLPGGWSPPNPIAWIRAFDRRRWAIRRWRCQCDRKSERRERWNRHRRRLGYSASIGVAMTVVPKDHGC